MPTAKARNSVPGSPEWWTARRAPASDLRRGRPRRSFERIVAAAAELVEESGPDAFSMRTLAARLDTSTSTLYRHTAGKEELMVYVIEDFLGTLLDATTHTPTTRFRSWKDAARQTSTLFHDVLTQHPNLLPLLVAQVPIGPNGLALRERVIDALVTHGFSPPRAARAYTTLSHYVIGFTVQQHPADPPGPAEAKTLGDYYRALDPGQYPNTVAAADALTATSLEDEFREGLEFLLAGIDPDAQDPTDTQP